MHAYLGILIFFINISHFLYFSAFLNFPKLLISSLGTYALLVSLAKDCQRLWHITMKGNISPYLQNIAEVICTLSNPHERPVLTCRMTPVGLMTTDEVPCNTFIFTITLCQTLVPHMDPVENHGRHSLAILSQQHA